MARRLQALIGLGLDHLVIGGPAPDADPGAVRRAWEATAEAVALAR